MKAKESALRKKVEKERKPDVKNEFGMEMRAIPVRNGVADISKAPTKTRRMNISLLLR